MDLIGYIGEPGSYTEIAAISFFREANKCISYASFAIIQDLLETFVNRKIVKAVLPIENSIEGIVTSSIDNLICESKNGFIIEGEIVLAISHNLIGIGRINEVKKIISHPQALAQCSKYIRKVGAEMQASSSTSQAVKMVAETKDPAIAAIGTEKARNIYSNIFPLKILAKDIQDDKNNMTRFFVLGHELKKPTGNDKTSLVFGTKNVPGALVRALKIFSDAGINMTHIASRPLKVKLGEYVFWVDIDGHQRDEKVSNALSKLKEQTTSLKILGSYPKCQNFESVN